MACESSEPLELFGRDPDPKVPRAAPGARMSGVEVGFVDEVQRVRIQDLQPRLQLLAQIFR